MDLTPSLRASSTLALFGVICLKEKKRDLWGAMISYDTNKHDI